MTRLAWSLGVFAMLLASALILVALYAHVRYPDLFVRPGSVCFGGCPDGPSWYDRIILVFGLGIIVFGIGAMGTGFLARMRAIQASLPEESGTHAVIMGAASLSLFIFLIAIS